MHGGGISFPSHLGQCVIQNTCSKGCTSGDSGQFCMIYASFLQNAKNYLLSSSVLSSISDESSTGFSTIELSGGQLNITKTNSTNHENVRNVAYDISGIYSDSYVSYSHFSNNTARSLRLTYQRVYDSSASIFISYCNYISNHVYSANMTFNHCSVYDNVANNIFAFEVGINKIKILNSYIPNITKTGNAIIDGGSTTYFNNDLKKYGCLESQIKNQINLMNQPMSLIPRIDPYFAYYVMIVY